MSKCELINGVLHICGNPVKTPTPVTIILNMMTAWLSGWLLRNISFMEEM